MKFDEDMSAVHEEELKEVDGDGPLIFYEVDEDTCTQLEEDIQQSDKRLERPATKESEAAVPNSPKRTSIEGGGELASESGEPAPMQVKKLPKWYIKTIEGDNPTRNLD